MIDGKKNISYIITSAFTLFLGLVLFGLLQQLHIPNWVLHSELLPRLDTIGCVALHIDGARLYFFEDVLGQFAEWLFHIHAVQGRSLDVVFEAVLFGEGHGGFL